MLLQSLTSSELALDLDWWRIYADSFPEAEREPREVILRAVDRSAGIAIRGRLGDRTAGMATVHLIRDPATVFLVYLALEPAARGRRYGDALFEYAWHCGAARLLEEGRYPGGLVCEVDDPDDAPTEDEAQIRRRRLRFFQRRGAEPLPGSYLQPPVDGVSAVPMRLLFRSAHGQEGLDRGAAEALVQGMYREKYGAINGIPDEILSALRGVETEPTA